MNAESLKNSILQYAIQGKLVEQREEEGTAEELYEQIQDEKQRLIDEGTIRKQKKPAKITEDELPFDIPETWKWVRLGEVGEWGAGSTPLRSNPNYYDGDIPWLKTGDLTDGYIDSVSEHVTDVALKETSLKINPVGSVLMAMYGATIGKLGILNIESTTNQACCACVTYDGIYNKYLFYYLMAQRSNFIKMGAGGAQPNISRTKIINYIISLPPLEEQKRIIEKIEELMPYIEQYGDAYEKVTTLNKQFPTEMEKSILQYAIQGKLVEQREEGGTAEELLKEIINKRNHLIKEMKVRGQKNDECISDNEKPFDIPHNWNWVRLSQLGVVIGGGTPKTAVNKYWDDGTIAWLTPADMRNANGKYISKGSRMITETGLAESSAKLMPKGTIVYSSRAPIGHIAIAENSLSTNQGFKSLVPAIEATNNYLYYCLISRTKEIQSRGSGTTFKEISGAEFGRTLIPLPPLEEQKRIVARIEELLAYTKKLISE